MRNSSLNVVNPNQDLGADDRDQLCRIVEDAAESGSLDFHGLPQAVQDQLVFAVQCLSHGEAVAAIRTTQPLSSTEAARALGMSRTHLTRLCEEGRISSFTVGTHLRIPGEEVLRILKERGKAMLDSRSAAVTADERRRIRAAQAAGLI